MPLRLLVCNGTGPDGQPCGRIARILGTEVLQTDHGEVRRHTIECESCGIRTQDAPADDVEQI